MKTDCVDFVLLVYILVYIFPLFSRKGKIHTQIHSVIGNSNFNDVYTMIVLWTIKTLFFLR